MTRLLTHASKLLIALLAISGVQVAAAEEPPPVSLAAKELSMRASASIEVVDSEELRLYDTISFYVRVSLEKAATSTINFASASVVLHGPAASLYESNSSSCQLTASTVAPGESSVVAICIINRVTTHPGTNRWLVIRPKTDAIASVAICQAGDCANAIRVTAPISLLPPLYAAYLGGCAGALALAVVAALWRFRSSKKLIRARAQMSKGAHFFRSTKKIFLETIMTAFDLLFYLLSEWGFASITAFVFIVLAQGTSVAGAPIQVTVTNFWGGVTIGLLAFPLNKWLLEKLGLTVPRAK